MRVKTWGRTVKLNKEVAEVPALVDRLALECFFDHPYHLRGREDSTGTWVEDMGMWAGVELMREGQGAGFKVQVRLRVGHG